jgi:hypothetical protein
VKLYGEVSGQLCSSALLPSEKEPQIQLAWELSLPSSLFDSHFPAHKKSLYWLNVMLSNKQLHDNFVLA